MHPQANNHDYEHQSPWVELRAQIISDPDDDERRLRYAVEWERHEELDRERAWLIRLQVAQSSLPGQADHPEWLHLSLKINSLLRRKAGQWTPRNIDGSEIREPQFCRGFIECVTATCRSLLNPATREALFAAAPIRHLNIVECMSESDEMRPSPSDFMRLVEEISRSGHAQRILSLRLDGQQLSDQDIIILAGSSFRNLQWLSLAYNQIGIEGVRALAEATFGNLRHLTHVNLQGNVNAKGHPYNPIEQCYEDQGIVIGRELPTYQMELPPAPWLRRTVVAGRVVDMDRYFLQMPVAVSRSRGAD